MLKRTDRRIWVDIGPDVVVVDLEDVAEVATAAPMQSAEVEREDLFLVARDSPTMSPKEHAIYAQEMTPSGSPRSIHHALQEAGRAGPEHRRVHAWSRRRLAP